MGQGNHTAVSSWVATTRAMRGALTRRWQLPLAVAVLASTLTSCSSCRQKSGAIADDLVLLPKDTTALVSLNVVRLRETALWRKLLDARDRQPELKQRLGELQTSTGLDPFMHVDHVTISFTEGGERGSFGVLVRGKFMPARLVKWAEDQAQKQGRRLESEAYRGHQLYRQQSEAVACFLDDQTLIVGKREWLMRVLDNAVGGAPGMSAKDNATLAALIAKTRTRYAIWAVGAVPAALRTQLADAAGKGELTTLEGFRGALDLAAGLELEAMLDFANADQARAVAEKIRGGIEDMKKSPQVIVMGLSSYVAALHTGAQGNSCKLSVSYNRAQVDALLERLPGLWGGSPNGATPVAP